MPHVKVPAPVMQEVISVLAQMPYAHVASVMGKLAPLTMEEDAPAPSAEQPGPTEPAGPAKEGPGRTGRK